MSALTETHALLATRPAEGWLLVELEQALGIAHAAAAKRLSKMMAQGMIGHARVPGRLTTGRYFATQAQADAWAGQQQAHIGSQLRTRLQISAARAAARAQRNAGPTIRERVLQAIQQAGSAGVIVSLLRDELGLGKQQMVNAMATLVDEVRCEWHKNRRLAWAAGVQPSRSEVLALQQRADADVLRAASKSGRTHWGHDVSPQATYTLPRRALAAPVTIGPARLMGEADTSRAHITRAEPIPYTARHQFIQLPPDPRRPSFSSIPLGATIGAPRPLQEAA